ncbi:M23 family metallopeptidase [Sphingobium yanoikuyae]
MDPINHDTRFHKGIDIPAASGTPVVAAADGVVLFAGVRRGYGYTVEITHPSRRRSRYAHLSQIVAVAGERVSSGAVIGFVGSTGRSTGPHLHFEYWIAGRPVDPEPYFARTFVEVPMVRAPRINAGQHLSAYARSVASRSQLAPHASDGIILGETFDSGSGN